MTGFVPIEELRERSRLRQPGAIIRWLKRHGVNPMRSSTGEPVVTWDALTAVMVPGAGQKADPAPRLRMPAGGRRGPSA